MLDMPYFNVEDSVSADTSVPLACGSICHTRRVKAPRGVKSPSSDEINQFTDLPRERERDREKDREKEGGTRERKRGLLPYRATETCNHPWRQISERTGEPVNTLHCLSRWPPIPSTAH